MGLIRKSLYLASGGIVAPNSRKQRVAKQQLAALQGATPQEVRQRGGRGDYDGFWGFEPASVTLREQAARKAPVERFGYTPCPACGVPVARGSRGLWWEGDGRPHQCSGPIPPAGTPPPSEVQSQAKHAIEGSRHGTTIRLSCGHAASITDPQTISWLSVEGDLSYRCPVCSAERPIVAIGQDATSESNYIPDAARAAGSNQLIDELERLASLYTFGALTEAEFQAAKAQLFDTK